MPGDVAWREKLANWQGGLNATVKELAKNQDELQEELTVIRQRQIKFREKMIKAVAVLQADASRAGRNKGIIIGVLASVVGGIILTIMLRAMGL